MKRNLSARGASIFGGLSIAMLGFGFAEDCKTVGTKVSKAIADEPAQVLVVVDTMVSAHEDCACDIVKAAISASSADKQLVREIVVTAATAAPSAAATIAECAVAEAPEAATEIKAGLTEVFAGAKSGGGKSLVYDDSYSAKGGKTVIEQEDVADDFGPEPVVISGVYLIAPSASSSAGFGVIRDRDGNIIDADEIARRERLISILRRRANEGRDSGRGGTTSPGPDPSPADTDSGDISGGPDGFASGSVDEIAIRP